MSNRLNRIYTRGGDNGTTSLANGQRIPKYHPRIEALGDVDELNSLLGLLLAELDSVDDLSGCCSRSRTTCLILAASWLWPIRITTSSLKRWYSGWNSSLIG
jgi:Uncharacterized conserved protein